MRGEDCYPMPTALQTYCGVNDQAFRAADTQIRVQKDNVLLFAGHVLREGHLSCLQAWWLTLTLPLWGE